jgi:hypothetical protein
MGYQSALPQTPLPVYQPQPSTHQAQMAYQAQAARTGAQAKSFTISQAEAIPEQAGIMGKITRRPAVFAAATGLLSLITPLKILFISKFTTGMKLSFWRFVTISLCELHGFLLLTAMSELSSVLSVLGACTGCTGIGALFGIVSVLYFPNYPLWRALLAGMLGGLLGGIPLVVMVSNNFSFVFVGIGMGMWGVICGFTISFVEEASRKAWLTVTWKTGKKTSVALGKTPISFGSSKEALVRLPRYSFDQKSPGISAVFTMEYDGKVFVRDSVTGTLEELVNGSRVDLKAADVVVHIARGKAP